MNLYRGKELPAFVQETPQNRAAIRGRGASWSPANRFEKLHVDQNDLDVVDVAVGTEEPPRPERNIFTTEPNRSSLATTVQMSASRQALIRIEVASMAAFTVMRGQRTSISVFPPASISKARSW